MTLSQNKPYEGQPMGYTTRSEWGGDSIEVQQESAVVDGKSQQAASFRNCGVIVSISRFAQLAHVLIIIKICSIYTVPYSTGTGRGKTKAL